ncbi:HNH endonuclease [Streptomyces sp. NBC_00683]|uniref:HNH endonuclease signature motif containing protein n=1 Tax=Streptomyces sp. NBC_00683 TaxID=2903670 RepID=UPI002E2FDDED|nr:HNH endonuclease signature motif containing protein [Streptomyces sp. NBC_00683]
MSGKYPRDLLERTAASATSLVDVLRRLGAPLGSRSCRYVRDRLKHYDIDTSHFVKESLPDREHRSYPKEVLAEAAAHSHSIREMFEYMGLPPSDSPYSYIRGRLDRLGIDTSHFTSGRRHGAPSTPRRQLTTAVVESQSLAGVLKTLGQVDNGGTRARLKRDIEAYGLSTDHFSGQGHAAGARSPYRKTAAEILLRLESGASRTPTAHLRRALDDVRLPHTCAICGTGDTWRGNRLVLEIDHINGDRLDNRLNNLRYLCPSCHSQTATFANRSR